MIGLDTNVIVRYLVQDDPIQAPLATKLMETALSPDQPGFIASVTLAEVVWVLRECYQANKTQIAAVVEGLLSTAPLVLESAEATWRALRAYEQGNADFSDALIAQIGIAAGCDNTITFDKNAAKLAGMELLPM